MTKKSGTSVATTLGMDYHALPQTNHENLEMTSNYLIFRQLPIGQLFETEVSHENPAEVGDKLVALRALYPDSQFLVVFEGRTILTANVAIA